MTMSMAMTSLMGGMASIWKKVNRVSILQLAHTHMDDDDAPHDEDDEDGDDVCDDDGGGGYDCISVAD